MRCVFNVIAPVGRQNDVYRPIKTQKSYRPTVVFNVIAALRYTDSNVETRKSLSIFTVTSLLVQTRQAINFRMTAVFSGINATFTAILPYEMTF